MLNLKSGPTILDWKEVHFGHCAKNMKYLVYIVMVKWFFSLLCTKIELIHYYFDGSFRLMKLSTRRSSDTLVLAKKKEPNYSMVAILPQIEVTSSNQLSLEMCRTPWPLLERRSGRKYAPFWFSLLLKCQIHHSTSCNLASFLSEYALLYNILRIFISVDASSEIAPKTNHVITLLERK